MKQEKHSHTLPITSPKKTIVIWIVLATSYCIAFMQRLAPQAMLPELAQTFSVNAAGLGILASGYFYGYLVMQIPAGIMVDAVGIRRVMLGSLTISTIGTISFALSTSLSTAFVARLAIACGDALVFTALLKFVALNFSNQRFGWMSGLSQVSGYLGGIIATTPLVLAVSGYGWRAPFWATCLVLIIALTACVTLFPRERSLSDSSQVALGRLRSTFISLRSSTKSLRSWCCALFFSSHFVAVTTLSGVWGLPMVKDTLGLSSVTASQCLLVFLFANILGSLVLGFYSDKIRFLQRALIINASLRAILFCALFPPLLVIGGFSYAIFIFALLGFVAGGTVPLILKTVRAIYSPAAIGIGASFNATLAGTLTALAQPLLGIMFLTLDSTATDGAPRIFNGYMGFVLSMAAVSATGIFAAVGIKTIGMAVCGKQRSPGLIRGE